MTSFAFKNLWLSKKDDENIYKLSGYKLISKPCSASLHGGLVIYIRDSLQYKRLDFNQDTKIWEQQLYEITNLANNKTATVGHIYRPPKSRKAKHEKFTREFTTILGVLYKSKSNEVFIGGDYNINLLKLNETAHVHIFFESVTSSGFVPRIIRPTRVTATTATLIDNFFVNSLSHFHSHRPQFLCINFLTNIRQ